MTDHVLSASSQGTRSMKIHLSSLALNFDISPYFIIANIPSGNLLRLKWLFIILQVIGGQFGIPLFIATMLFSSRVKRHLMLVNFCGSWIIYSIVYCLTFVIRWQIFLLMSMMLNEIAGCITKTIMTLVQARAFVLGKRS